MKTPSPQDHDEHRKQGELSDHYSIGYDPSFTHTLKVVCDYPPKIARGHVILLEDAINGLCSGFSFATAIPLFKQVFAAVALPPRSRNVLCFNKQWELSKTQTARSQPPPARAPASSAKRRAAPNPLPATVASALAQSAASPSINPVSNKGKGRETSGTPLGETSSGASEKATGKTPSCETTPGSSEKVKSQAATLDPVDDLVGDVHLLVHDEGTGSSESMPSGSKADPLAASLDINDDAGFLPSVSPTETAPGSHKPPPSGSSGTVEPPVASLPDVSSGDDGPSGDDLVENVLPAALDKGKSSPKPTPSGSIETANSVAASLPDTSSVDEDVPPRPPPVLKGKLKVMDGGKAKALVPSFESDDDALTGIDSSRDDELCVPPPPPTAKGKRKSASSPESKPKSKKAKVSATAASSTQPALFLPEP